MARSHPRKLTLGRDRGFVGIPQHTAEIVAPTSAGHDGFIGTGACCKNCAQVFGHNSFNHKSSLTP